MPDTLLVPAAFAWVQPLPGVAVVAVVLAVAAGGLILVTRRGNGRIPLRPALGTGLVLSAAWIAYGLLAAAQIEAAAAVPQRGMAQPPARAAAKTPVEPARLALESPTG